MTSFSLRSITRTDYPAGLAVTLAPLVYFVSAWRDGLVLSPDDGVIFNVPLRVLAANLIRDGYLPLWNPYIFSGMPLHGSAQSGLLFPLNWFYLAFSPPLATNLMMLSAYALAGLGAYLFARRSGSTVSGAVVTGLVWQWCAFPIEQIGHTNIVHTAAMLPWVLWAVDGYLATGERRTGVLVAAFLALQFFAGHQQTFTYSLLLTIAYALVVSHSSRRPLKSYLVFAALILAGLALSAVQILPTLELLHHSLRATATYDFFSGFSLPPKFVLTFFAPYVLGGGNGRLFRAPYIGPPFFGEYLAYAGLLTLMLATCATILKRDTRTVFWAVVFVVALLMAFGHFLPFNLYRVVYQIPLLNLFRSPARHLMEVQFALAVLAGRGLSALQTSTRSRALISAVIAGAGVFLLTSLTVTWWRPAAFQLARKAPAITVLRAPELFLPIFIVVLSVGAIWVMARYQRKVALIALIAVLMLDLFVYGHGSGWHLHSPGRDHGLWRQPETVSWLFSQEDRLEGRFRILTEDIPFDPFSPVPTSTPEDWLLSLQPDIYMMHRIENAAGYDGFGLGRYSKLAGDMKIWGELTDAERTLRGESRELDLLNVRYLFTRPMTDSRRPENSSAMRVYSGQPFAENDLKISSMVAGQRLSFSVPPTQIDHVALMTNLSWSNELPNGAVVAHLQLRTGEGQSFDFDLLAGEHTSEWAHDRPDIKARVKHRRALVGTSYVVEDAQGKYEGHTYVSSFTLPQKTVITSGSITLEKAKGAPEMSLNVARITLADGDKAFPLQRESITIESSGDSNQSSSNTEPQRPTPVQRWKSLERLNNVAIFENTRVLPRAWLASQVKVLSELEILQTIRTGKLPDGQLWDPRSIALVENPIDFDSHSNDDSARVEVLRHEPNRVALRTRSSGPSILILSENHYPGWRSQLDGRDVETLRVDYNLRGVVLPAGEHDVEIRYRPKSVLLGGMISLLALVFLVIWWKRLLPGDRPSF